MGVRILERGTPPRDTTVETFQLKKEWKRREKEHAFFLGVNRSRASTEIFLGRQKFWPPPPPKFLAKFSKFLGQLLANFFDENRRLFCENLPKIADFSEKISDKPPTFSRHRRGFLMKPRRPPPPPRNSYSTLH